MLGTHSEDDDRRLVAACLKGDASAWAALHGRYAPLLRRAALARLKAVLSGASEADAEEVLQRLWAKLAADGGRVLASFGWRSRLGTWLVTSALREASDYAREESSRRGHPSAPERTEVPSPLAALIQEEDAARLREALGALPPRDRLLLRLHYWEGLSYREIAGALGVAEGSVSPLLARAREALRKKGG